MEQGRPARCVELDPFKPTFLKRDAHSLCELQASQPRLEVGSNEAPRRQPTCHLVQVLIGSPRPERGFLKLCAVCAFFFSVPSQGKRTEFFCCYPSVHLDTIEFQGQTYLAFFPAVQDGEEAQNEEEMGLVILKAIQENGEEILSTLDSDEEIDAVYNEFMKELFAEEEEAPE